MSCPDRTPDARLPIWEALALGALHGPAELLPISSSGHVALVPWLLSMRYVELDDELRKSFEVVVHAGTAAALLITLRDEVSGAVRDLNRRRLTLIALSFVPPAIVGYALERPIERHLGTPGTIAVGLLAGSVVMASADRAPQERHHDQAGAVDALWLGVAQASALIPGRVAQRGHARGGAASRFHARGRQPALAPRRAPGHRRRHAAQGNPSPPSGTASRYGRPARRRRRRVVRLDARVDMADPPGRTGPLAAALCHLSERAGHGRAREAAD